MLRNMNVFPIGGYNWMSAAEQGAEAVKDWVDAGLTLTFGPHFDHEKHDKGKYIELLDEAHHNNIKVILPDNRGTCHKLGAIGEDAYRKGMAQAVEDFAGHPAVFGFNMGDEPEKADFDNMVKAYAVNYELAPNLTPFSNVLPYFPAVENRVGYTDWRKYLETYIEKTKTEFLSYDCYTQMNINNDRSDPFFENLLLNGETARKFNIPMWSTILSTGHYNYRCPNEDELRWQLSNAVAHGAKGIMYWFIYLSHPYDSYRVPPVNELGQRTETFGWLARVNKTFLKYAAGIMCDLDLQNVMHFGKTYGGVPELRETALIKRASTNNSAPLVLSEFKDKDGGNYVVMVNNSMTEPTQARLTLKGTNPRIMLPGWNEKDYGKAQFIPGIKGERDHVVYSAHLAPGQLDLVKIENGESL